MCGRQTALPDAFSAASPWLGRQIRWTFGRGSAGCRTTGPPDLDYSSAQRRYGYEEIPANRVAGGLPAPGRHRGDGQRGGPGHPRPAQGAALPDAGRHQPLVAAVLGRLHHRRHSQHQHLVTGVGPETARPCFHAEHRRDHLPDLPHLSQAAGQVPDHAVCVHRRGDELLLPGVAVRLPG